MSNVAEKLLCLMALLWLNGCVSISPPPVTVEDKAPPLMAIATACAEVGVSVSQDNEQFLLGHSAALIRQGKFTDQVIADSVFAQSERPLVLPMTVALHGQAVALRQKAQQFLSAIQTEQAYYLYINPDYHSPADNSLATTYMPLLSDKFSQLLLTNDMLPLAEQYQQMWRVRLAAEPALFEFGYR